MIGRPSQAEEEVGDALSARLHLRRKDGDIKRGQSSNTLREKRQMQD